MKLFKGNWFLIVKRIPFFLLVFCIDLMYVLPASLYDFSINCLIKIIIPILYFLSFISLFLIKKEPYGDYSLIKMAMIGKIVLIPWFVLNAIYTIATFLGGIMVPVIWFALPIIFIMDLLVLLITSLYASLGIYSFYKKNQMPFKRLLIVLEWIFVADVLGTIVAFVQCKRKYTKISN